MERKSLPLSNCNIKLDGDTGRFAGYASIFGGVDSYGDTIVKGAYDYTLRKNGKPKMFYGHEAWKMPIGKWLKLSEDDTGLYVEGELTLGMSTANDVHAALKHGTLDGMSIGYALSKDDYEQLDGGGRLIKRVTRLAEVSVVNFPADSGAKVDLESVKSALDDIELAPAPTRRRLLHVERWLLPATLLLTGAALGLSAAVGLVGGLIAARWRGGWRGWGRRWRRWVGFGHHGRNGRRMRSSRQRVAGVPGLGVAHVLRTGDLGCVEGDRNGYSRLGVPIRGKRFHNWLNAYHFGVRALPPCSNSTMRRPISQ